MITMKKTRMDESITDFVLNPKKYRFGLKNL